MPGLLDNWMNNPLTHVGLGLTQSMAPRYSTNIADLNGGGIGAGLLQGVHSYNAHRGQQQERAIRGGLLQAKQRKIQAEQEALLREQQARESLIASVQDPEKQQILRGLLGSGADVSSAYKAITPSEESMPSAVREYQFAKSQGYQGTFEQWQTDDANRRRPTTTINNNIAGGQTGLLERALTREEAAQAGIPPEKASDYTVKKDGALSLRPVRGEDPRTKELRIGKAKLQSAQDSLNEYQQLIAKHGTEYAPGPDKRQLEASRAQLLLELKELYNLGALQAPDMEIMEGILADPTTIAANVGGILTMGGNKDNYLSQLDIVRKKIHSARRILEGKAPKPTAASQQTAPQPPPGSVRIP